MRPSAQVGISGLAALAFVFGCGDNRPGADEQPVGPPCSDGVDNDDDGTTDFPDDLGCDDPSDETEDSPAKPQCSDRRDNDGDGLNDFPNDPGCLLPQEDDETDDCPDGANCPQCGNGRDDDGNGSVDYPADPGCESAGDAIEFVDNPVACGAGLTIKQLPPSGMDSGTLDGTSTSNLITPCGGGGGSPGIAYVMVLTSPAVVVASTDHPTTAVDTVIDIRSAACATPASHITCSDDLDATRTTSKVTVSLPTGVYYIIVEGHDTSALGAYTLTVEKFAGEGSACAMSSECGPGLVCRIPVGGSQMVCSKPVCSDGLDDDADTKIDFPNDPGCVSPADDTEDDDCPSGPNCPQCANGLDDDGDTLIDFPLDTSCNAAAGTSEACNAEQDPISAITTAATMGTLVGAHDDHEPSCGFAGGGLDVLHTLTVPAMATLTIDTEDSMVDTLLSLLPATCAEPSLACDDDGGVSPLSSLLDLVDVAAGTYVIAVDGFDELELGTYNLNVSGTIAPGGSCESPLFVSGVFTCATGFVCDGTVGARTCRTQCSDGIDNNGNGTFDFPNDPGCQSPADNDENTVCPGATCPACADGADNDGDGQTDFPLDTSCVAASGASESCLQAEAIAVVTLPATPGTTVGQTNDFEPSCATSSGASGPDVALQLDLPAMQSLTLNLTTSYDSVHVLLPASCGPAELVCRDPTAMTTTGLPAGRYFLIVDGFFADGEGTFTLNTSGIVAPGGSCESALFASGAIACSAGLTCDGPAGARTCRSECSDGIDNNGDGPIDFPNDPGCSSLTDNTETTVCPGAACPACSNLADDDSDTFTDFPTDFGCIAAGGTTEVFCAADVDFKGVIATPATAGTLATPAVDNFDQSCQSTTGNDATYALLLPVPVASLVIDTLGSTITDTVLSLKDANCGVELGCDDDSAPGSDFRSVLTLIGVPAGSYAINVDSFSTGNNGAFTLNVKGTVAPGTACTASLFTSGVLVCPAGTTCNGVCQ